MEWHFGTNQTGPVPVEKLRETLERDRDHFLRTQQVAAEADVLAAAPHPPPPGAPAEALLAHGEAYAALRERAGKAKASLAEKHADPLVVRQMALAVDQAVAQAELMGGVVTAVVRGHFDRRHRSGCHMRVEVKVDKVE